MKRHWSWICCLVFVSALVSRGVCEDPPLTPASLRSALEAAASSDPAPLAERVRAWFGPENLPKGPGPKVEGLDVAWAIEAPGAAAAPKVASEDNSFSLALTRIGATDIYAGVATLTDGTAFRWAYDVDGKKLGGAPLEVYAPRPENQEQPGTPKGTIIQQPALQSAIFPGTTRDWWIYVPAQYKPDTPAGVMFFQDGGGMKNYVPTTFDNLIAKGDMPVTVGIFINPGVLAENKPNRSFEYDTLSDQYARFLLEEILPIVEKGDKPLNLRHDAAGRAICGISSGGICAFTAAWEHPDQFGKVLSFVGSFTNIASGPTLREGGHNYPALIRKTPPKPIRVFLQDGENDLDNVHGNWPLANQEMAKALQFAGYDYKFEYGHGFHSDLHGRAILPDALRWLWRN
ncbi:enterochelin esterase [Candidatus Sumerlaeota bacterium]|nr:enterochelin esterase [Candidatus Sumerlaeota bacterium]